MIRGPRLVAALSAVAILAVIIGVIVAAGGDSGGSSSKGRTKLNLLLDFFPNADHAGIYAAQANGEFAKQGLDVHIRAPSDPSTPLKLVAAGKADFAISYEPEVLRARDKGADVVSVAALIRTPLTSIVSLPKADIRSPSDLAGRDVGTAGIDYQSAYMKAIEPSAHVRNVGFDLVPALVSGKVDAVLGAYWNYEAIQLRQKGRRPRVIRIEQAGGPTNDELVVVVSGETAQKRPDTVRRFLTALRDGTEELASDPGSGINPLLKANRDLDPKLQAASVRATLPYMLPKPGQPYGFMNPGEWVRFTAFMHDNKLLSLASPRGAFTNLLLPVPAGATP